VIPVFWSGLFLVIGGYSDIYRRFRTKELGQTLLVTLIGSMVIFFALVLDDTVPAQAYMLRSFLALFGLNFLFLFTFRILLTSRTVRRVHRRKIGFNTLLVGGNERAVAIHQEIEGHEKSPGNRFVGFVNVNGGDQQLAASGLLRLGKWTDLRPDPATPGGGGDHRRGKQRARAHQPDPQRAGGHRQCVSRSSRTCTTSWRAA
jgi:FlaA1/EpsC-like NDP-sugar epimerase